MGTPTELQKAQIIKVEADKIYVAHPDLSNALQARLTEASTVGDTGLEIGDNLGWADNDWFIFGVPGDVQTEEGDVNDATGPPITRASTLTVTNSSKFTHAIDTPITRINERQIRILGGDTTSAISNSVVAAHPIHWNRKFTVYQIDTGATSYTYYTAEFFDGGSSYGAISDYVAATDLGSTAVETMIQNGLKLASETIDSNPEGLLSREKLLVEVNNWQDDIRARRDWSFELTNDETITATQGEIDYALSSLGTTVKNADSEKSIVSVKLGRHTLKRIDWHEMLREYEGWIYTTVGSAITASDTTATLTNSNEFGETGSISVGSDTAVEYTANTESTGVLSGISASAFASSHAAGIKVFQGVSQSRPTKFCIYNNRLYTNSPCSSEYDSVVFRVRYYQELSRVADYADTVAIPFTYLAQYWLASRIEYIKGNHDRGDKWFQIHEGKLAMEVRKDRPPTTKKFTPIGDDTYQQGPRYKSEESSKYNWD